jgi:(p)ppGpp synthase/HD superfamily hydrolase
MKANPLSYVGIAREAAVRLYAGRLYGERPYWEHLAAVVAVLLRFGFDDPVLIAAAWLHDALEDGVASFAELVALGLPPGVIAIIVAVSDEPGANRRERKRRTYPKIAALRRAVIVKLADRIANVEAALKKAMYAREHGVFRAALYRPEHQLEGPWEYLDRIIRS